MREWLSEERFSATHKLHAIAGFIGGRMSHRQPVGRLDAHRGPERGDGFVRLGVHGRDLFIFRQRTVRPKRDLERDRERDLERERERERERETLQRDLVVDEGAHARAAHHACLVLA